VDQIFKTAYQEKFRMTHMTVDTLVQYAEEGKSNPNKTEAFERLHTGLLQLQEQDGGTNSDQF